MDTLTKDLVRRRAGDRCEYCRLEQAYSSVRFHVEHIVAKQHGGSDDPDNLALACQRCNLQKGPNLTGIDPSSKQMVGLFDPRKDEWSKHFQWRGIRLEGLTSVGRATVQVLRDE